ncbi:ribonucleotide-diphosphate reductase subunit alpha [Spiroplasma sabaudiense Ar-1343]|uniref:Vitamin B12-dependent ribonucleotide reductase n=1 Tax=Spiroplasma sabaudiense Ar-1343 TaxID=1276257 RepID=W6AIG3_9MOLU|nr:vitamin B12-dependent ribonucleotide reductase [Spiroplasma sabaudiense]AHI53494.1 ribonucleotide-diphosphate reductase subunit alpha [Spiroplasma sabaudiense Ar-1343]
MYSKKLIESLNNDIKTNFQNLKEISPNFKITFEGVSRMVMLDRYSQKDLGLKTLKVGDLVITTIKPDPVFPSRGIGKIIKKLKDDRFQIQIEPSYVGIIDPELTIESGLEDVVIKNLIEIDKPLEIFWEQIAYRVGQALGRIEKTDQKIISEKFTQELEKLNVIPAGRVLFGAGSNSAVTFFNCYVMPFIKDDRVGIAEHRQQVAEIMSRGGGVGTNGSTLRPRGAIAKSVGGKSSGSVSWLNDLSGLTHLIEQGGSRRGAQMIMMADWHPDIIEFIISKMQNTNILLWLREHSQSQLIREQANNKLRFKHLTQNERKMHEAIIQNKKNIDENIVGDSKAILKAEGVWTVANPDFLSGANISVTITDKFMWAVERDLDWELKFPDLDSLDAKQKNFYDTNWDKMGDVFEWENKDMPTKVYNKIPARDLWDLINFCATYSAEPGIFFIDKANKMTNAQGYGMKVVATNPCGEQPLAPYSVCNLAAINLENFVDKQNKTILYEKLAETVANCVQMQDNVIDATPYFLEANKIQALGERRVGLGVMGLHDMLIWAGLRYGSSEANKVVDKVFETICLSAYRKSIEIAKIKGSFPFLKNKKEFIKSGFIQSLPKEIQNDIEKYGIRNSHLLTVAPTGSTGTMVGASTGLEPYFAFSYFRSGRLGKFMEVKARIVEEWLKYNPEFIDKPLPDIFVSAMELSPEEHADVQCIIQRWVDSSISKTVNAPKGYTVKQVEQIYNRLYKGGAKGGTVYVDGSRDTQVLSLSDEDQTMEDNLEVISANKLGKPVEGEQKVGNEIGDLCPVCSIGTLIDSAGCVTCNNCGAQLKCGL